MIHGCVSSPEWTESHLLIANKSFEKVAKLRYLETKSNKGIKSGINLGNACCHSVQNHFSSRLLSKNTKIEIYKTIILPLVLSGCGAWSLTLREEHRLRVF
jgi:hypothetical protein